MSEVILADASGVELRSILFREYDFEIGDKENTFLVTCNRAEWENVPDKARVYIPGTECGGILRINRRVYLARDVAEQGHCSAFRKRLCYGFGRIKCNHSSEGVSGTPRAFYWV